MTSSLATFFALLYKTNRFHVAVRLFSNRSQNTSKCDKNISDTLDVICDLLLNRRTVTWNLFVKCKPYSYPCWNISPQCSEVQKAAQVKVAWQWVYTDKGEKEYLHKKMKYLYHYTELFQNKNVTSRRTKRKKCKLSFKWQGEYIISIK